MECKKVLFPVWPAKPDCNIVYSCSEAPEPSRATAHAITLNITAWDLQLLQVVLKSHKITLEPLIILLTQYWFENMLLFLTRITNKKAFFPVFVRL